MGDHCPYTVRALHSLRLRVNTFREQGNEANEGFIGSHFLLVSSTPVQRYVGFNVFSIVSTIYKCGAVHRDAREDSSLSKEETTPTK